MGWSLLAEKLDEAFRVVTDQDLVSDDDRWSRLTSIFLRQFARDSGSGVNTALFKFHSALGEEILYPTAGRATLLRKDYDLGLSHAIRPGPIRWAKYATRGRPCRGRASAARGNASPATRPRVQAPPIGHRQRSAPRQTPSSARAGPLSYTHLRAHE